MTKNTKYILTYGTQVIFETVVNGKQCIGIMENGNSIFNESTLKRIISDNEKYYVTNLSVAKLIAKDILGSVHGAPYIFMDMVWVPLESYNKKVMIYVALHHIERIIKRSESETILQLTHGVQIQLEMSKRVVYSRLFVAYIIKQLIDLKKKHIYETITAPDNQYKIIKERGNVYYTKK